MDFDEKDRRLAREVSQTLSGDFKRLLGQHEAVQQWKQLRFLITLAELPGEMREGRDVDVMQAEPVVKQIPEIADLGVIRLWQKCKRSLHETSWLLFYHPQACGECTSAENAGETKTGSD